MDNSSDNPETNPRKRAREPGWLCSLSIVFGVIAILPYCSGFSLYLFDIKQPLAAQIAGPSLFGGFCFGLLFGLPSIILGILGGRRLKNKRMYLWMPLLGILLSLGALAGQAWFFLTCQFCQ
jgi:hypothetical protein